MIKFFRKHNKKLVAIFMALLMIVFVGGSALQNLLASGRNIVLATSNLGEITRLDQDNARAITQMLERMGMDWQRPAPVTSKPLTLVDWILLSREAERLGFSRSEAAMSVWAGDQVAQSAIYRVAHGLRVKPSTILASIGKYLSVREMILTTLATNVPSEASLRQAARDVLDKVKTNAVVLPASAFINKLYQPDAAELEAQLEAHRNAMPESGLNFGYYVLPAVKLQYIRIDRDVIAEKIGIPNLESQARAYYEENRETEFLRPEDEVDAEVEDEEAKYFNFEEARETAIEALRRKHANEAADRIANWLLPHLSEPWEDIERGEDRYKVAPEEVKPLSHYGEAIEHLPPALVYEGAATTGTTNFFTKDQAVNQPGIGAATFSSARGRSGSLQTLPFRTKEIVDTVPSEEGVAFSDYLATFQTCGYSLKNVLGDVYIFRVIEVRAAHPAESVEEVRIRLVNDLRLKRGYEEAKRRAEELKSKAVGSTLKEVFDADPKLKTALSESGAFGAGYVAGRTASHVSSFLAAVGRTSPKVRVGSEIGLVTHETIDDWFALEEADEKVMVVELPDVPKVVVVEWAETIRGREDEYNELRPMIVGTMASSRTRNVLMDWLDPENIRTRYGFKFATQ